jgi:hypothetical protein
LGFEVSLDRGYKLCDFRPAFGFLFSDLLEGYDFYGYGDIDVIYGNIRKFISDELLTQYDAISIRAQYFTGFFAILRNCPKIVQLFRESSDYQLVFQSPGNYCFDEMNWDWEELMKGTSIFQLSVEVQSMTYIVRKMTLCGEIKSYFNTMMEERCEGRLEWNEGTLTFNNKELLLYHFYDFKSLPHIHIPSWKTIPNRYFLRSFYFSRYAPESLTGRAVRLLLQLKKAAYISGAFVIHLVRWLFKYLTASRKVKAGNENSIDSIIGTYRLRHEYAVDIQMHNGCLYVRSGEKLIKLLHRENNRFLVSRFFFGGVFDIDIEFHFNKENAVYGFSIIPFLEQKATYFKI